MTQPTDTSPSSLLGDAPRGTLDRARRKRVVREALFGRATPLAIRGRYQLRRKLGQGGMGTVYLAWDQELKREVALKLVTLDGEDSRQQARLLREARAQARLSHPNVVEIFEAGIDRGRVFLTIEYVAGETLRAWLSQKPRHWSEIVRVFVAAGRGLAAAHDAGLVHRDFKPENVMIGADGRPRVLDFGLSVARHEHGDTVPKHALEIAAGGPQTSRSRSGTPAYMSPEQFRGQVTDGRSDQFSFCVALYEQLFGERPFPGKTPAAIATAVLSAERCPWPTTREVPQHVRAAIERGLALDPGQRHADMPELLDALSGEGGNPTRLAKWLSMAVGVSIVGFAVWPQEDVPSCQGSTSAFDEAWGPERRAAVATAFAAVDGRFSADVWLRIAPRLDAYADEWTAAHQAVCEASHGRGGQTVAAFDAKMSCLHRLRDQFEALSWIFREPDPRVAASANAAVTTLEPIAQCVAHGSGARGLPADPAERRARAELRKRIGQAQALRAAEEWTLATTSAREALKRAEEVGHPPLLANAQFELGVALSGGGEFAEAREQLSRSYFTALSGQQQLDALRASVKLVHVHLQLSEYDVAFEWARHARALLDVSTVPQPLLERDLMFDVGWIFKQQARFKPAREQFTKALEFCEQQWGESSALCIEPIQALADIAAWEGRWAEAIQLGRSTVTLAEAAYGPHHPSTSAARGELGFILLKQGNAAEARVELEASRRGFEDAYGHGTNDQRLGTILNHLGSTYEALEEPEKAREVLERAHELSVELLGPEHPHTAFPLNNIGNVLVSAERYDEARDYYQRARAILEAANGSEHLYVSFPLMGLGWVAKAQQRFGDAVVLFERVVAIRDKSNASTESVELARFDVAEALWHLPGRRDEALVMVRASLTRLETAEPGPDVEALREELKAFIATGRPREPETNTPE